MADDEMRIDIPEPAAAVIGRLKANGFEAYAVGGCVRDSLLGLVPNDWDVTTPAKPETVEKLFNESRAGEASFRAVRTGIAHGTVTVVYSKGESSVPIEVTTYRIDGKYSDHRHPGSVSFTSSLEADLARRDFTVNAMAYSPGVGIIDPYGGQDDLEAGLIRCVGEPEKRFNEDALRILRALRFSAVLGFDIEEKTAKAACDLAGLIDSISRERVYSELSKLIAGKNAPAVIRNYRSVLSKVLPIYDCSEVIKKLGEVGWRSDLPLLYAALLCGTDAEEVLHSLRAEKRTIQRVNSILSHMWAESYIGAKKLCAACGVEIAREIQLLAFARGEIPEEYVAFIDEIEKRGECVSIKQLKIDGRELRAIGIEPAQTGKVLSGLLGEVISGRIPNERSSLAEYAAKNYL